MDIHDGSSPHPVPAGTVHLWLFRLDVPEAGLDAVLDPAERSRAAALTGPARRGRFVVAHAAARSIVARYLRIAAHEVCWVRTGNGKPSVTGTGLGVNLSHS